MGVVVEKRPIEESGDGSTNVIHYAQIRRHTWSNQQKQSPPQPARIYSLDGELEEQPQFSEQETQGIILSHTRNIPIGIRFPIQLAEHCIDDALLDQSKLTVNLSETTHGNPIMEKYIRAMHPDEKDISRYHVFIGEPGFAQTLVAANIEAQFDALDQANNYFRKAGAVWKDSVVTPMFANVNVEEARLGEVIPAAQTHIYYQLFGKQEKVIAESEFDLKTHTPVAIYQIGEMQVTKPSGKTKRETVAMYDKHLFPGDILGEELIAQWSTKLRKNSTARSAPSRRLIAGIKRQVIENIIDIYRGMGHASGKSRDDSGKPIRIAANTMRKDYLTTVPQWVEPKHAMAFVDGNNLCTQVYGAITWYGEEQNSN